MLKPDDIMGSVGGRHDVVTGAFSYTGRFVAARLLAAGHQVSTLTNHPDGQSPMAARIGVHPLNFQDRQGLLSALSGADTLYNTYWVRSNRGAASFARAVENTRLLLEAARQARVRRIVHVSIANPTASTLPYYRGKADLEEAIIASGLGYAIVRPTLLFGHGDVLINNIAWFLRHLPVFGIPGDGRYRLQPVYVEDYADLIVEAGQRTDNLVLDAAGPEVFTFEELVTVIRDAMGRRTVLLKMPPALVFTSANLMALRLQDMVLTRNEIAGLMAELLVSSEPSRCTTRFTDWLKEHHSEIGRRYASEVIRHYRLPVAA
jgi:NADH dehydrogenase